MSMESLLSNEWVVGIGVTVIGGLILYFFGVGRNKKVTKSQRVGILNKGKNNKFINNTFSGFDVGIQDEGESSVAKGNDFK